ncbi:MAG: helix-turn-helix domain-containing protein [Sphingomonadaceae bacterium]
MIEFAMLVLPGAFYGGIAALMDGFFLANERRQRIMRNDVSPDSDMRLTVLSTDGAPICLDKYTSMEVDRATAPSDRFDFLWLPAFRVVGEDSFARRLQDSAALLHWLDDLVAQGCLIGASGSSTALPLAAGLGQDLSIPVIPALSPTFRMIFPRVKQDAHREVLESPNLLLGRGIQCDTELVARAFDRLLSPATGHWLRSVMGQIVETRESKASDPVVESARLWLEQRFADHVSIAGLAAELNISQAMLLRRFKAELGVTPAAFVTSLRLATAKRLLAHSNRSIENIAAAVGYNDSRNFRDVFHRHTGVNASQWRDAGNNPHFV